MTLMTTADGKINLIKELFFVNFVVFIFVFVLFVIKTNISSTSILTNSLEKLLFLFIT